MNWESLTHNQVVESCDSTNNLARELARAGAPNGTWISAKKQSSGRGRLGRTWASRGENLYLSMVFRLESTALAGWIPLRLGLAAHAATGVGQYGATLPHAGYR